MILLCGCTSLSDYIHNGFKVGPNYVTPPAPVAPEWIDAADKRVRNDADDLSKWWENFEDPILSELICTAYKQNLTLREAGARILAARAQYGTAVGEIFPQTQFLSASYQSIAQSGQTGNTSTTSRNRNFGQWNLGFTLAWEMDFWGRFRRAVESAGANLDASVHDYDDVVVTLLSDVASNYVQMRTLEERIRYARKNVDLAMRTVKVVEDRKAVEVARQVDVDQARSVMFQTEAIIPQLEVALRQTANRLCVLLGIPPEDLQAKLQFPAPAMDVVAGLPVEMLRRIPQGPEPERVAVGIPADLLRRRPDIRRAERHAAAQSALIGVAEADFYPHISLTGNLGWSAQQFKNLFTPQAFNGSVGPSVHWDVLNYGRILNNVRLQGARFQELTANYQHKVLEAQQEVEDGLITFVKAHERVRIQRASVKYSDSAVNTVHNQFVSGTVTIAQLIQIQQNKVLLEDTLAQVEGEIALGLIQVYKALGGGWQIRCNGCEPSAAPRLESRELESVAPRRHRLIVGFGQPH